MVELLCPHCDEEMELPSGDYGEYECPHCDEEFDYEEEEVLLVGMPTKFDEEHEKEILFIWRWFFFGLWMSAFWVIPSTASIEGMYYGPSYGDFGVMICWLWPLTAVVTTISGFGLGNKALGTGALVGMAISPLLWFMGCMTVG